MKLDWGAILAAIEAGRAERAAAMPDEDTVLRVMFAAWERMQELGWRSIDYCPKDGSRFDSISAGSTGIHPCRYEGEWPTGSWWVEDGGDLWPARPIMFRVPASPEALPSTKGLAAASLPTIADPVKEGGR